MIQSRRQFVVLAISIAASSASQAATQPFPTRPVRLLVGFTAGGIADVVARIIAKQLTTRLGQTVIVENHPGAAGNLAMEVVANAAPDGHTILLISSTNAINESLRQNRKFGLLTDIIPVASIYRDGPGVMVVRQEYPVKSLSEFIAYAKVNVDAVNFASAGIGSTQHLYGEMFKMLTGLNLMHVPYRGAPLAIADLIAGHVQLMFDTLGNCLPYVRAGTLRALGVTTRSRIPLLPHIPAVAEFVPGYCGTGWQGIGAPKGTPRDIVSKLNSNINAALADSDVRLRLAELGYESSPSEPEEFKQFVAADIARWAEVAQFAKAKADKPE